MDDVFFDWSRSPSPDRHEQLSSSSSSLSHHDDNLDVYGDKKQWDGGAKRSEKKWLCCCFTLHASNIYRTVSTRSSHYTSGNSCIGSGEGRFNDERRFSNEEHYRRVHPDEIVYHTDTNGDGQNEHSPPVIRSNNEEIEYLRCKLSAAERNITDLSKHQAKTDMKCSRLHCAVTRLSVALTEISEKLHSVMQQHSHINCGRSQLNAFAVAAAGDDDNSGRAFVPPHQSRKLSVLSIGTVLLDPAILGLIFDFLGQGEGLFVIGVNHTWKYIYNEKMGGGGCTSPLAALKSISRLEFAHTHGLNFRTLSVRVDNKTRPLTWFAVHLARSDTCFRLAELAGTDACKTHIASGAASGGRLDILKDITENHRWKLNTSVLCRAAEAPTPDVLKWFYAQKIGLWDQENKEKFLLHAACCGSIENAKFLLNVQSQWHQHTIVSAACFDKIDFIRWCRSQGYSNDYYCVLSVILNNYCFVSPSLSLFVLYFYNANNHNIHMNTTTLRQELPIHCFLHPYVNYPNPPPLSLPSYVVVINYPIYRCPWGWERGSCQRIRSKETLQFLHQQPGFHCDCHVNPV